MPFWEQLGQQAAGSVLGIGLGAWNDARQIGQQNQMNEMNKRMMDYSMQKQYDMWQKTGYVGQVEQMKKAGINPALMYGMGGGGGQSLGAPGGGGATATGHSGEATGMGIAAANIGLMDAQRRNLDADTENKKAGTGKTTAETANVPKTGENIQADTAVKTQEVQNKQAQQALTEAQTANQKLTTDFDKYTYETRAQAIEAAMNKINAETQSLNISNETDAQLIKTRVATEKAELAGIKARNELTKAQEDATRQGIQVDKAQIQNMAEQIRLGYRELAIKTWGQNREDKKLALEAFKAQIEKEFQPIWNVVGSAANRTINWLDEKIGTESWGRTPTTVK